MSDENQNMEEGEEGERMEGEGEGEEGEENENKNEEGGENNEEKLLDGIETNQVEEEHPIEEEKSSVDKKDILKALLVKDEGIGYSPKKKHKATINVKNADNKSKNDFFKNSKAAFNLQFESQEKNPEFTADFRTALVKVLAKMNEEPDNPDNKILKLLVSDQDKLNEEISKLDITKKSFIDEKVKGQLFSKQKNLENIVQKLDEEFDKIHPFTPLINSEYEPRNFTQFIEDQAFYLKKIEDKKLQLKNDAMSKEDSILQQKPQIDKNSKLIAERKIKEKNDPTHVTLKKMETITHTTIKGMDGKVIVQKDRHAKANKHNTPVEPTKLKSKIKVEGRSIATLYDDAKKKEERLQNLKTKFEVSGFHAEAPTASESSNKFMLKKFENQYNSALLNITTDDNKDKINLYNLNQLFENLKLISPPEDQNQSLESLHKKPEKEFNHNLVENSLRQQEKKLVTQVWENLKDDEGNVNTDHLFLFLLSVINLYEFHLYSSYKKDHKLDKSMLMTEILNTESPKKTDGITLTEGTVTNFNNTSQSPKAKTNANIYGSKSAKKSNVKSTASASKSSAKKEKEKTKEDLEKEQREQILAKIQSDLNDKIKISKKYCSYDNDNNFVISIANSKLINKEFSLFYVNWSTYEFKEAKNVRSLETSSTIVQNSFKPTIDAKSAKMSQDFRRKVQTKYNNNQDSLNYIETLTIQKKKKEIDNLRLKDIQKNRELEECTFKPHLNDHLKPGTNHQNRIDKIYESGKQLILSRKQVKDKNELELERQQAECRFAPKVDHSEINLKNKNIHYNSKDNDKLRERLKKGREEAKIKQSVHERGVTIPVKKPKLNTSVNGKDMSASKNESTKKEDDDVPSVVDINRKVDIIPKLIIDVNIRPGVKKKIYVYDGDTAEELTDKFGEEHEIEGETREKLKLLIEAYMSKLLEKIDENEEHEVTSEEKENSEDPYPKVSKKVIDFLSEVAKKDEEDGEGEGEGEKEGDGEEGEKDEDEDKEKGEDEDGEKDEDEDKEKGEDEDEDN